jgi:hypothetical protein
VQEKSGIERVIPWLPTILGVAALVAFTIVTIVRLVPGHSQTLPPPPEPAFTLPGTTSGPQAPISLVPTTSAGPAVDITSPDPKPTSRAIPAVVTPPRTTTRTTKPARPILVSGQYHVLNSFDDSFIGEVLLTNRTSVEQNWTVTVSYPGNLHTSWLESLPQPTLVQRGHTFTWTSSVPLAVGSSGQLRFQFDIDGSETLDRCTVNGLPCS